jgi:hypothetical protein
MCLRECRLRAADPDDAGPEGGGDTLCADDVLRHDGGGKTELGVVGKLDGFVSVLNGLMQTTENLLDPGVAVERNVGKVVGRR